MKPRNCVILVFVVGCMLVNVLTPTAQSERANGQEFGNINSITPNARSSFRDVPLSPVVNQAPSGYPAYYIVLEMTPDGTIQPLYYRPIQLASPLDNLSDRELTRLLSQTPRDSDQMIVSLESADGKIAYQNTVEIPRILRGEFHGNLSVAGSPIDGHFFPLDRPAFVVRVPSLANASLIFQDDRSTLRTRVAMNELTARTLRMVAEPPPEYLSAQLTGDPSNRVDLLVMGDGYTVSQQTKFVNDANTVLDNFFGITPYLEYRNLVNVYSLFTPSNQAGADHPPYQAGCTSTACCGDPTMLSDPLKGLNVDTAFDARYCANNIHRLLVVNNSKILAAASAVPNYDKILVIVNDTTYGGSGGTLAVTSIASWADQIAQHEYAHSFARLADEYDSPYPGYPPCSDTSGSSPCEANVTNVVNRSQIKWSPWINPTTPIPTSQTDPMYTNVVGLFEGARYQTNGMFRPGQNCLMRSLGQPFCKIPSQTYVLRLYNGGWGAPSAGIELIEPSSAVPGTSNVTVVYPKSQSFQTSILQPIGAPPVQIQWVARGVVDPAAHSPSYTFMPTKSDIGQSIQVRILVSDTTTLVHPAMAGTSLQSNYTWSVTVLSPFDQYLPLMQR